MSKHETWRTRLFWNQIGGLLIEEFIAVRKSKESATRLIDGVIILNEKKGIHDSNYFDVKNRDVIVIQTKASRLGMYLLGQALFSRILMQKLKPNSVRSVAICGKNDPIMEEMAKEFDIEIVVIEDSQKE